MEICTPVVVAFLATKMKRTIETNHRILEKTPIK